MTLDRTYWRACDDKRLIEEARDSSDELAIALGERLSDRIVMDKECDDRIRRLENRLVLAQSAIECLKAEVGAYEDMFSGRELH